MDQTAVTMDKIVSLCKRRGFIFPSSEIYGGVGSTYDFGHYGVLLKTNVKDAWWKAMLRRGDIVALDSAIIQHPDVWRASGHVENFSDPLVDCRTCGQRFRADQLDELACPNKPSQIPGAGPGCALTEARPFNLMFETQVGAASDSASRAWLRPETAQGIFINFRNVLQFSRKKPPFGIAQVGKSFRNEITPRNFIFRTREFEQMEMEFFVHPDEAGQWYDFWRQQRLDWYVTLGIRAERLRLRDHDADELSHYSSATADVEYDFPIGWRELEGIAHRGDFDLTAHAAASGVKLEVDGPDGKYVPHVIEPAAGADRAMLAFLCDAYREEELEVRSDEGELLRTRTRTVLALHPRLAPVKAAVMALARNKPEMVEQARRIHEQLAEAMSCELDIQGNIGKAYSRQDEIGTPWCVTVDGQTLEDGTVTVRDRDTLEQERVSADALPSLLAGRLAAPWQPAPTERAMS